MPIVKLFCYVDESGQDTKGKLFVVSVVILRHEKDDLLKFCEIVEKESGKGKFKWGKAEQTRRIEYIRRIFANKQFKGKLHYSIFHQSRDYDLATIVAVAKAIHWQEPTKDYSSIVYVDGLSKTKRQEYGAQLRKLGIHTKKVQGIPKDESNALIRLADAISGFIRDAIDTSDENAKQIFSQATHAKILVEV